MNRLGIFVFFDAMGIADRYIQILLDGIMPQLKELVIVINGNIDSSSKQCLQKYSNRIFYRENVGYDAGAYKDVFLYFLKSEDWGKWDEIVLFNDSFYAPIHSWKIVFDKMQSIDLDFWGLSKHPGRDNLQLTNTEILPHIQSYFLVCRRNLVLSSDFENFWRTLDYPNSYFEAVENFEIRFSTYLSEKGFTGKAYTDVCEKPMFFEKGTNPHSEKPYELLKEIHFPVLKRKALSICYFSQMTKALEYIKNYTSYDTELIFEHMKRLMKEDRLTLFNPNKLEKFVLNHERIYIYGYGLWGKNIGEYFKYKGWRYEGFIVTELNGENQNIYKYNNMKFCITDGIILALGRTAFSEVYPVVKQDLMESQLFIPY